MIFNTCVPPQILDILKNLKKTLTKMKERLLRCISANADVGFFVGIFVLPVLPTISRLMYCYF